jgi:hypothetical protein
LSAHAELKFVNHVRGCLGCSRYVEQVQRTIQELRSLPADKQLAAAVRGRLLATFTSSVDG